MSGEPKLIAQLLYSSGLRLNEVVQLRVKDLDLEGHPIIVRDGKGAQDRISKLSETLLKPLKTRLAVVIVRRYHISLTTE